MNIAALRNRIFRHFQIKLNCHSIRIIQIHGRLADDLRPLTDITCHLLKMEFQSFRQSIGVKFPERSGKTAGSTPGDLHRNITVSFQLYLEIPDIPIYAIPIGTDRPQLAACEFQTVTFRMADRPQRSKMVGVIQVDTVLRQIEQNFRKKLLRILCQLLLYSSQNRHIGCRYETVGYLRMFQRGGKQYGTVSAAAVPRTQSFLSRRKCRY